MELAHLVTGQIIIISTLLSIFRLSDDSRVTGALNAFTRLSSAKDEKCVVLLLVSIAVMCVFVLDFLSSHAKVSRFKRLYRNIKRGKAMLLQNVILFFIVFIVSYVYRSISQRIYNLSGMALLFMAVNLLGNITGFRTIVTWGYFGFFTSNLLIAFHTFVPAADAYYALISRILRARII